MMQIGGLGAGVRGVWLGLARIEGFQWPGPEWGTYNVQGWRHGGRPVMKSHHAEREKTWGEVGTGKINPNPNPRLREAKTRREVEGAAAEPADLKPRRIRGKGASMMMRGPRAMNDDLPPPRGLRAVTFFSPHQLQRSIVQDDLVTGPRSPPRKRWILGSDSGGARGGSRVRSRWPPRSRGRGGEAREGPASRRPTATICGGACACACACAFACPRR